MTHMSLIMLFRSCLTADRKVSNSLGNLSIDEKVNKTYFSSDKRFAAAACGTIPTVKQWEQIRNILDCHIHAVENDKEFNARDEFDTFFTKLKMSTHLICVLGEHTFLVRSELYSDRVLTDLHVADPEQNYLFGTGQFPARVLVNSGEPIDQERFFRIVSLADNHVSAEFDLIELNQVIDSYWYKKERQ